MVQDEEAVQGRGLLPTFRGMWSLNALLNLYRFRDGRSLIFELFDGSALSGLAIYSMCFHKIVLHTHFL